jgi:GAF domain-containing protein
MPKHYYQESHKDEKIAELLESRERYRIILEINNTIISNLKLHDLFQSIAEAIKEKFSFDVTAITLYDPERDLIRLYTLQASIPLHRIDSSLEVPKDGSDVGWVLDNKKPLVVADLSREGGFSTDKMLLEEGFKVLHCYTSYSWGKSHRGIYCGEWATLPLDLYSCK